MTEIGYGRLRDLGGLPDLLSSLAGEEGLNRAFRDQGLPIALLATPDTPVPMPDLIGLYHRAAEITGTRSFGLNASSDIEVNQHGLIGEYVTQARDLPRALERFRAALPYHESGSSLEIQVEANELRVSYRNIYQGLNSWRHAGDFTLCVIADVIGAYLGDGWRPLRIETCYAKGPWEQDHEDVFGAPVRYEEDRIAIVLDREIVEQAAKGVTASDRLLSLGELGRLGAALPRNFPQAVANIVERRLIDGATDLDGSAQLLGLGPRTVQRRLSDHGLSYRDLVSRCRMRRARELLAEPDMTVRQVGQALGYASTPQFTRAFKACLGATPQEFRRTIA